MYEKDRVKTWIKTQLNKTNTNNNPKPYQAIMLQDTLKKRITHIRAFSCGSAAVSIECV